MKFNPTFVVLFLGLVYINQLHAGVVDDLKNNRINSKTAVQKLQPSMLYLDKLQYLPQRGQDKGVVWTFLIPEENLHPGLVKKMNASNRSTDSEGRWTVVLSGADEKIIKSKLQKILVKGKSSGGFVKSKRSVSATAQIGSLSIKSDSEELSMNFFRLGLVYRFMARPKSFWQATGMIVNFRDIKYSLSSEEASPSTFYPEFSFSYTQLGYINLSYAFDYLNYFVATQSSDSILLKPHSLVRLGLRPSLPLNDLWSLGGGIGFLKNVGSVPIIGFDGSIGISRFINEQKKIQLTGGVYASSLKVNSDRTEKSTAFSITGMWHF